MTKSPNKFWTYYVTPKKVRRFCHIFVALSEYMNFIRNDRNYHDAKPSLLTGNQKDSRKLRGWKRQKFFLLVWQEIATIYALTFTLGGQL